MSGDDNRVRSINSAHDDELAVVFRYIVLRDAENADKALSILRLVRKAQKEGYSPWGSLAPGLYCGRFLRNVKVSVPVTTTGVVLVR